MGVLIQNFPDIVIHEPRSGVRVELTVHRQPGIKHMVGFKFRVHHAIANVDVEFPETNDIASVYDVLRYCKEPAHTARDATFDTKMTALWGSTYTNLASAYKDDIFSTWRAGEIIPPPP